MAPEMLRLMRTSRRNVGRGTTSRTTMAITAAGTPMRPSRFFMTPRGDDSELRTGRSLAA